MTTKHTVRRRRSSMTLAKAINLLRQRGARLVQLHTNDRDRGLLRIAARRQSPGPHRRELSGRNDVQPYDAGLFPGHPQSWRVGNLREWPQP
jgi:hypothetical protein